MIVILGREGDRCGQLTFEILRERGAKVVIIDGSKLFSGAEVGFSLNRRRSDSFFTAEGQRIPYSDIKAVLVRGGDNFQLSPDLGPEDQNYFWSEMTAALDAIKCGLQCPVFNRLSPQMTCSPFKSESSASRAVECGFQLPRFIATASIDVALDFYLRQNRRVLVDDMLGSGVFHELAGPAGLQVLKQIIPDHAACLAERPAGPLVGCVVVTGQVFGANSAGKEIELSSASREKCCRLADVLQVPFLMLTIICADGGRDYCLDISPQPVYPHWEDRLQEKVAVALADALQNSALEAIAR